MAVKVKPKVKLKKKPVLKKPAVKSTKRGRTIRKKDIDKKIQALVARGEHTEEFNFDEMTPQEKYFCELFASDQEFFGNGTKSYITAFDVNLKIPGAYDVAKSRAYQLLTQLYILAYINHLMELGELNDTFVDRQHAMLIIQNADFKTKMQAIKHYDIKKGRIIKRIKLSQTIHNEVSEEEQELIDDIFDADDD